MKSSGYTLSKGQPWMLHNGVYVVWKKKKSREYKSQEWIQDDMSLVS